MTEYRAYLVGSDGHFIGYEAFVCTGDSEAIERAKRLVNGSDIELWDGGRFVKRLIAPNSPAAHKIKSGRMVPKK
jgi:hypothetical protein